MGNLLLVNQMSLIKNLQALFRLVVTISLKNRWQVFHALSRLVVTITISRHIQVLKKFQALFRLVVKHLRFKQRHEQFLPTIPL